MTEKILETNEKYLEKIQQSFEEMTNANEQLFKGLETFMNLEVEGTNATEREQVFSQDKVITVIPFSLMNSASHFTGRIIHTPNSFSIVIGVVLPFLW